MEGQKSEETRVWHEEPRLIVVNSLGDLRGQEGNFVRVDFETSTSPFSPSPMLYDTNRQYGGDLFVECMGSQIIDGDLLDRDALWVWAGNSNKFKFSEGAIIMPSNSYTFRQSFPLSEEYGKWFNKLKQGRELGIY